MNPDTTEGKILSLENERERYITRLFWFALEIALIFLLPALLVSFIVTEIWSKKVVWYALPVTFILSWVIVIWRWMKLSKILKKLDQDILELKRKKHAGNN